MRLGCISPADGRECPVEIKNGQAWAACGPLSPVVEIVIRSEKEDKLGIIESWLESLKEKGSKVIVKGRFAFLNRAEKT